MADCLRVLSDEAAAGTWNMAVDEALLETAARGTATLRFYRWCEPTLSLGYFQRAAERNFHSPSLACAAVRRTTGGGAILHHHDLTYSLCVPANDRLFNITPRTCRSLYHLMHHALLDVLSGWGISAAWHNPASAVASSDEPFLCFERRAEGDVTIAGRKILGSAQRRSGGAVLQHGSILLARSPCAPSLEGLADVANAPPGGRELAFRWQRAIEARLGVSCQAGELTPAERETARKQERTKFACAEWWGRR